MTIKIQNLNTNGNTFDPYTYNENDNLEALIVSSNNEIASIRVSENEGDLRIISNKKIVSNEFYDFIEYFENEYAARDYIINGFQEYIYPFYENFEIKEDTRILVKWSLDNMVRDDRIKLITKSYALEIVEITILRGDDGIIVEYLDKNKKVVKTQVYYFDDFDDNFSPNFPTSCSVTSDYRPNITLDNPINGDMHSYWYKDTFTCIDDALDYLKVVYNQGVHKEDIGFENNGTWLKLDELQVI